jgi:hypothetical protein
MGLFDFLKRKISPNKNLNAAKDRKVELIKQLSEKDAKKIPNESAKSNEITSGSYFGLPVISNNQLQYLGYYDNKQEKKMKETFLKFRKIAIMLLIATGSMSVLQSCMEEEEGEDKDYYTLEYQNDSSIWNYIIIDNHYDTTQDFYYKGEVYPADLYGGVKFHFYIKIESLSKKFQGDLNLILYCNDVSKEFKISNVKKGERYRVDVDAKIEPSYYIQSYTITNTGINFKIVYSYSQLFFSVLNDNNENVGEDYRSVYGKIIEIKSIYSTKSNK